MAIEQKLDIGRVIVTTFQVLGRNIAVFGALTLLLVGLPTLLVTYGILQIFSEQAGGFTLGTDSMLPITLGGLVAIITSAILQGALLHGTIRDLAGRPASFAECLATGLRNFLPLIIIGFLAFLGVVCGLILLVVPGIILALMWSVAAPARVAEGVGVFEAFGRSRELTRNNRLLMLVLFLIYAVVNGVLDAVFGAVGMGSNPIAGGNLVMQSIGSTIVDVVGSVIIATALSVAYVELRRLKEGVEASTLAATFD